MIRPVPIASAVESFAARTPTLPPATRTQSYALGEREVLLVEPATPFEDEQREWVEWARSFASAGRRVVAIFATHYHPDHVGGAAFFAEELGLPVWTSAETAERIRVPVSRRLTDGEAIRLAGPTTTDWQVLHTPGHASDHLCLFEPHLGFLVAGDMVATEGTIIVAPGDGDMGVYLTQLERLKGLEARAALPAHGDVIADPRALFDKYIRHRRMREAKVLAALGRFGPDGATLSEVLPFAYDDTPEALFGLAALSLQAHLDFLVVQGLARTSGERYWDLSGSR